MLLMVTTLLFLVAVGALVIAIAGWRRAEEAAALAHELIIHAREMRARIKDLEIGLRKATAASPTAPGPEAAAQTADPAAPADIPATATAGAVAAAPDPTVPAAPPPAAPHPAPAVPPTTGALPPPLPRQSAAAVPPAAPQAPGSTKAPDSFWEDVVAGRWLAWLGALAFFFGAVFALQWSIQAGLVPPWVRILSGFAGALALLGGGCWPQVRARAPLTAAALVGAGILVGFATSFSGHALYRLPLFTVTTTFLVNTILIVTAVALADRLRQQSAAWLGLIGGFLTPLLLGRYSVVSLATIDLFVLLLTAGALGLVIRRGWLWLGVAAVTVQMVYGFSTASALPPVPALAAIWPALAAVGLVLGAMAWLARRGPATEIWPVLLGLTAFGAVLRLSISAEHDLNLGWIVAALLLIELAIGAARVSGWTTVWSANWLRAAVLLFVGMQLGGRGSEILLIAIVIATLIREVSAIGLVRRGRPEGRLQATVDSLLPLLMVGMDAIWRAGRPDAAFLILLAGALVFLLGLAVQVVTPGTRRMLPLLGAWALLAWSCSHRHAEASAMMAVFGLTLVASLAVALFQLSRRQGSLDAWMLGALAGPVHYFLLRPLAVAAWPELAPATWPILAALAYGALLFHVSRTTPRDLPDRAGLIGWYGGTLAAFLALAVPDLFGGSGRLAAWAIQGAVFAGLARRRPEPWLVGTAILLLTSVAVWVIGQALSIGVPGSERGPVPVWAPYLVTQATLILALAFAARCFWWAEEALAQQWSRLAATGAGFLLFILLHFILADGFSAHGMDLVILPTVTLAHGMAVTILWAAFGLVSLIGGLRLELKAMRIVGICLLLAAMMKLFVLDLAELGALPRVAAFMVVAALAMTASYLVQRARKP